MNMNTAYSELYISDAQKTIAHSFDYAVNKMNLSLKEYAEKFLAFKYLNLLESGDPHYVAGISGIELAKEICGKENTDFGHLSYEPKVEYWTGWILSYYQWAKNTKYKTILSKFPIEKFEKAYPTFHECNKNRMIEYMDEVIRGKSYERSH